MYSSLLHESGKVDILDAYKAVRNSYSKSCVIVDPSSVFENSLECWVHEKIRLAFLIAFVLEENSNIWTEVVREHSYDLWFVLVTVSRGKKIVANGHCIETFLDPIDSLWEINLSKKVPMNLKNVFQEIDFSFPFYVCEFLSWTR
jgi:hypothetical protein